MRAVFYSDVAAAARALMAVPPRHRAQLCEDLLRQADWADKYTRRLGKPHPVWGSGTLLGAARSRKLVVENTFDDRDYRAAFGLVLTQIDAKKEVDVL